MPVTLRFQTTGRMPDTGRAFEMRGDSISIGRAPENDMVLTDPERMISKRHCVIERQSGTIAIADFSTNGTFLNYGKMPIGKSSTTLNHGDILTVGPYEILVEITAGEASPVDDLPEPYADPVTSAHDGSGVTALTEGFEDADDILDELIGVSSSARGPASVKRPEIGDDFLLPGTRADDPFGAAPTQADHSPVVNEPMPSPVLVDKIPDDWSDDLLGPTEPPLSGAPIIPEDDFLSPDTRSDPVPTVPDFGLAHDPPSQNLGRGDAAVRAFLEGLGAENLEIGDDNLEDTFRELGLAFQSMIAGTLEVLQARASVKAEFRMTQTRIEPRGNNPLKFSATVDEALAAMLKRKGKAYLGPAAAAEGAMRDIAAHEMAMMSGMDAAMKGLVARFSPDGLEEKIERNSGLSGILKGKKAQYWKAFEAMHAEISEQAEDEFFELFGNEFSRAYREQLERLKTR